MISAASSAAQPVAFVLTGGASYGALQVGMLQALTQSGIRADLVVGTSAGALNAAAYAADPTPAGLARLAGAWENAKRARIFSPHAADLLPAVLGRRDHLISSDGLRRWLFAQLELDALEHAVIPLHVIATDLETGQPEVLSTGDALTALLASCAVPGLFPPVRREGQLLVDGGISADTPVPQARELGAATVYVLPTHAVGPAPWPRTAARLGLHAYNQISAHWTDDRVAASDATVHLIPAPQLNWISPLNLSASAELVAAGKSSAERWLASRVASRFAVAA